MKKAFAHQFSGDFDVNQPQFRVTDPAKRPPLQMGNNDSDRQKGLFKNRKRLHFNTKRIIFILKQL